MLMRQKALIGSVVSLGAVAMVGAGLQPGNRPATPPGQAKQPGRTAENTEYGRFTVTEGEDGRRVYLWGFNGRSGQVEFLGTARASDAQVAKPNDGSPAIYREYHYTSSNNGRRIFVWGYNPGEGRIELVSSAEAPENRIYGAPEGGPKRD